MSKFSYFKARRDESVVDDFDGTKVDIPSVRSKQIGVVQYRLTASKNNDETHLPGCRLAPAWAR